MKEVAPAIMEIETENIGVLFTTPIFKSSKTKITTANNKDTTQTIKQNLRKANFFFSIFSSFTMTLLVRFYTYFSESSKIAD